MNNSAASRTKNFYYQQFKFSVLPSPQLNINAKANCITSHKFQIHFYLSITSALDEKTIVSIDDDDKSQYHEVNFNTSK